jgi:hypothetical protein
MFLKFLEGLLSKFKCRRLIVSVKKQILTQPVLTFEDTGTGIERQFHNCQKFFFAKLIWDCFLTYMMIGIIIILSKINLSSDVLIICSESKLHWLACTGNILWQGHRYRQYSVGQGCRYRQYSVGQGCRYRQYSVARTPVPAIFCGKDAGTGNILWAKQGHRYRMQAGPGPTVPSSSCSCSCPSTDGTFPSLPFPSTTPALTHDTDRRVWSAAINKLSLVAPAKDKFVRRIIHEICTYPIALFTKQKGESYHFKIKWIWDTILSCKELINQMEGCYRWLGLRY